MLLKKSLKNQRISNKKEQYIKTPTFNSPNKRQYYTQKMIEIEAVNFEITQEEFIKKMRLKPNGDESYYKEY